MLCLSAVVAVKDDGIFKPFLNPEKLLALGDWAEKITSVLARHDIIKRDTLYLSLLKNIKRSYSDNGIVNWRNETLGHGALAYKDDPEIVSDLQKKIRILTKFFTENADAISSLMLYQESVALKGESCGITPVEVSLIHKGTSVSVEPFIIVDANLILYFDSYRRAGSAYLDYINGKKSVISYPIWGQKLKKFYSKVSVQSNESVESEIYLATVDDEINAVNHEYNYIKANYMTEWVNSCLDKNTKGAFLLCAERGTGKSAFAYALDELSGGTISFTDCTTRSYLDMAKENIFKALDVIEHSGRPRSSHETEILVMVLWRVGQVVNTAKEITLEDLDFAVRSIISGLRFIDERIFAGSLGLEQPKARLLTSFALLCSRRYALHYNKNTCDNMDMLQSDYNQALGAISTAEAIWKLLDEMGVEYDIPSAIMTYVNYGYILSTFKQCPEGLKKINKVIEKFKPKNPDEDKAIQMALTARIEIQGDYEKWKEWKAGQNS